MPLRLNGWLTCDKCCIIRSVILSLVSFSVTDFRPVVYCTNNQKIPKYLRLEDYAVAIADVLNQLPRRQRPQLRLETGRHLIDDAGYLITSVVAVKRF